MIVPADRVGLFSEVGVGLMRWLCPSLVSFANRFAREKRGSRTSCWGGVGFCGPKLRARLRAERGEQITIRGTELGQTKAVTFNDEESPNSAPWQIVM